MARKKAKEIPFGDVKWVLNNLSADELEDMEKRKLSGDEIMSGIQRMVEGYWTVSIKWDHYSGAVQCTCIQKNADDPNAGYAFSGRSDDLLDAITICYYKFFVVADGNLAEFYVERSNVRG